MAQIASEDYVNKIIYLHIDTVSSGFDPALMQKEHRALRRLDAGGERMFDPMVTFVGNDDIGGGKKTQRSTRLRAGVTVVPFDSEHALVILNQILNIPDGKADKDVFDRSSLVNKVDIDKGYNPVEVIEVATGGGSGASAVEVRQEMDANSTELAAIKAKSDLLPSDPAGISDIPTTDITAIKGKTDTLPASPADVSDIPTADENSDAVWTNDR